MRAAQGVDRRFSEFFKNPPIWRAARTPLIIQTYHATAQVNDLEQESRRPRERYALQLRYGLFSASRNRSRSRPVPSSGFQCRSDSRGLARKVQNLVIDPCRIIVYISLCVLVAEISHLCRVTLLSREKFGGIYNRLRGIYVYNLCANSRDFLIVASVELTGWKLINIWEDRTRLSRVIFEVIFGFIAYATICGFILRGVAPVSVDTELSIFSRRVLLCEWELWVLICTYHAVTNKKCRRIPIVYERLRSAFHSFHF